MWEKYIIPEIGKKAVFARINDAWRRYKNFIKRSYFVNYPSLKERLKNRPNSISENHFRALMTYWTNNDVQDVSQKNAMNRAKQKYIHHMGPTNFARIRANLRAKKESEEMFLKLKCLLRLAKVEKERNSSEIAGEAFQSLFGKEKPGRVRYMGRIVTPTMLKRNDEIAALKKQHSEEMSSMSKQLKGMKALLRCFMKQNNPELDDEALDNMMGNAITPRSSASAYIPNHNECHTKKKYVEIHMQQNRLGEDEDQHQDPEDAEYDDVI
ncbi:putative transposase, Ptta/En/Spm, plant [Sesbania bispinosa]|nr:putative transposase, Ptta/En/Spm, plant [Sesbania bispinosa]